ncbi:paraquat-inducible protein A [Oricola cellulosilytica]|uniref:Paraquat-inducible protein A n=1 Tax=Oricola cellulosilytica TaxID=1429082 RepID=A0A4R0PFK4_9HYPH|nr:paraquat-inducible protein A [Oricola cellulosilytica]TCD15379.1 paraquat-inducible protein A [Oricola cellulosilytica]
MRTLPAILLALAAFALALGVSQPLLRFEHLVFFSRTPSLAEIIRQLWIAGDALLAVIVALFSVAFPAGKILAAQALLAASDRARSKHIRRALTIVSKWSMTDVLLVALLIFAAKTSGLADAFTQPGLWFYGLSAAAAAAATALLR